MTFVRRDIAPHRHGVNGYANLGCRCATCRTAWATYNRERRARAKAAS